MKQYVIDELRYVDYEKVKAYLDEHLGPSKVRGVYWVPLDTDLLDDKQANHVQCQPFYFAVELEEKKLSCELLIRTQNRVRCSCISYASEKQRNWIIQYIDAIFDKLEVIV